MGKRKLSVIILDKDNPNRKETMLPSTRVTFMVRGARIDIEIEGDSLLVRGHGPLAIYPYVTNSFSIRPTKKERHR